MTPDPESLLILRSCLMPGEGLGKLMLKGSSSMFLSSSTIVYSVVVSSVGLFLSSTRGERGAATLLPEALIHFLDEPLGGDSILAFLTISFLPELNGSEPFYLVAFLVNLGDGYIEII
jgi:hypothetical protein